MEKAIRNIYGHAIGDALGYPTEFMFLPRIKVKYGPSGIQDLPTFFNSVYGQRRNSCFSGKLGLAHMELHSDLFHGIMIQFNLQR